MPDSDAKSTTAKWVPPYVSFKTISGLVVRMETEGTPPRVDRSFLSGLSGGYQSQVLAALKAMDLIDAKGDVQPSLIELVDDGENRGALIGKLVRKLYPKPVELGTINATQGQLEEAFRDGYGVNGDTMRKAIAFYLAAAKYGDVPTSRNFRVPSVSSDGRRGAKKVRKPESPKGGEADSHGGEGGGHQTPPDSEWIEAFDAALIAWVRRIPVGNEFWPKAKKDHWFVTFRHIVDAILPDEPEGDDDDYDEEERG
ncbi:MAG TPA: DUF5343 domain-containing protein [Candidatus Acidoferrales bacterium]|nr:DUF5343 domain-containing protein [Candidatus Acidoferrales bacterium]